MCEITKVIGKWFIDKSTGYMHVGRAEQLFAASLSRLNVQIMSIYGSLPVADHPFVIERSFKSINRPVEGQRVYIHSGLSVEIAGYAVHDTICTQSWRACPEDDSVDFRICQRQSRYVYPAPQEEWCNSRLRACLLEVATQTQ